MSKKFQPLTVKSVIHETQEAFSIYFENPGTPEFEYKPGQYLILQANVDGKPFRRAFSLSTAPNIDKDLAVTIKCIDNGKVSNFLHQNLKSGDILQVMPPQGNFTVEIDPSNKKHYVLIGGGSGITPLISIIRSVLEKEPYSTISLLYANNDEKSIIFRKSIESLQSAYGNRFNVIHSLDNPTGNLEALSGMLNEKKLNEVLDKFSQNSENPASYYLCGPPGLMELTKKVLKSRNTDTSDIHQEHFTASLPEVENAKEKTKAKEEDTEESNERPAKAMVTVLLDGEEHTLEVRPDESILEAAIDAGIDPPFACQEGICTTCQAKLHDGRVFMEEDEGLTDEEIEEGYILTCQSHPLTKIVKVEYE